MDSKTAQNILQQVKITYSQIAKDFDYSRKDLWPEFQYFLQYIKPGDTILDAGCGNGRLIQLFSKMDVHYIGCDNNPELIEIAKRRYPQHEFLVGNILFLPCKKETFHAVFCIAMLHHIPSIELRVQALRELRRILVDDGLLFVTTWNLWQIRYFPFILKWTARKFLGRSSLDFKDIYIPWKGGILRYYHVFTFTELQYLISRAGFQIIEAYRTKYFQARNLVVIARKQ